MIFMKHESALISYLLASGGDPNVPMSFTWSGKDGQPSWVWGGNDSSNMYVYNPANFSVKYATSAGGVTWNNVTGDNKPLISRITNYTNVADDLNVEGDLQVEGDLHVEPHYVIFGDEKAITDNTVRFAKLPAKSGTIAFLDDIPSDLSGNYLPLTGGTMTGQIKGSFGGSWNAAREQAMVYNYNPTVNSYNPIIAGKSGSGVWSVGTYPYDGENLYFAYNLDSDYNAGNNGSQIIKLPPKSGTIALTSDLPTWNSIKPTVTGFAGIALDDNGAYIYGQNNSGNIFFRYKANASDTDYSWANVAGIINAINSKAASDHTHNYLPLTGGNLTGTTNVTATGTNEARLGLSNGYGYGYIVLSAGGKFGMYDSTHSKWIIYNELAAGGGSTYINDMLYINSDLCFDSGSRSYTLRKTDSSLQVIRYDPTVGDVTTFRFQNTINYSDNNIQCLPTYNNTSSGEPNMYVSANGNYKRGGIVSAAKYKLDIKDIQQSDEYYYNILKLKPRQWFDKGEIERYSEYLASVYSGEDMDEDRKQECIDGSLDPYYGLIAEDVEAAGLEDFCLYKRDNDGNKELDGIRYMKLPVLMIPILRDLVSCMNKILPYAKKNIDDKSVLAEVKEIEKRFNSFKEEDIINKQYDVEIKQ